MASDNPCLVGWKSSPSHPHYPEEHSLKKDSPLSNLYGVSRTTEKPLEDEYYNPYQHREVKHATTFNETLFHMLKASLGTGILAMPNAFHNSGYVVGTVGTLIIGFLCTYCIHILVSSEYELCCRRKKPSLNYPETLEAALLEGPPKMRLLSPYAQSTANILLAFYQIGGCCILYVFVAYNIKDVADYYVHPLDVRMYMVILLIPFLLINWVRKLKFLAPFSTVANFVAFISYGIIAFYVFTDIPSVSEREAVAPFSVMPLFFGTVIFAMEAIGVVMPLENEMAEPTRFGSTCGVLNGAMITTVTLYTLFGFFGYLKYGSSTLGSITLNLPHDHLLAQSAKLMLAFAIYVSHGLQTYVSIDIIWNQYLSKKIIRRKVFWEYVTRTFIVFITFFFAVAIPNLELFISFIGALCLSIIGLIFPALIQMLTYWDYYKGFGKCLFVLKNLTIVLIALLGLIVGVTTSVHDIYLKFFAG